MDATYADDKIEPQYDEDGVLHLVGGRHEYPSAFARDCRSLECIRYICDAMRYICVSVPVSMHVRGCVYPLAEFAESIKPENFNS
jgi:hypothetical protein